LDEAVGAFLRGRVPPYAHGCDEHDHDDEGGDAHPAREEADDARFGRFVILAQGTVVYGFCQRRHAPTSQPA
jgi:hypothetical protein